MSCGAAFRAHVSTCIRRKGRISLDVDGLDGGMALPLEWREGRAQNHLLSIGNGPKRTKKDQKGSKRVVFWMCLELFGGDFAVVYKPAAGAESSLAASARALGPGWAAQPRGACGGLALLWRRPAEKVRGTYAARKERPTASGQRPTGVLGSFMLIVFLLEALLVARGDGVSELAEALEFFGGPEEECRVAEEAASGAEKAQTMPVSFGFLSVSQLLEAISAVWRSSSWIAS